MAANVNNMNEVGIELGVSPVSAGRRVTPTFLRQGMRRRVLILGGGRLTEDLCETLNGKWPQFTEVVGILDCDSRQVGQCIAGHKDHRNL